MEFLPISTVDFERFILVLARVSAIFVAMPVVGSNTIPAIVKVSVAVAVSLALFPVVAPRLLLSELAIPQLAAVGLGEIMLGLSMGLLARMLITAVDIGFEVVGFQMGYGVVTAVDPTTQGHTSILGQFQTVILVLMFLATDSHHFIYRALAESFRHIPPMGFAPTGNLFRLFMQVAGKMFFFALKFAAPIMVALLLTNVALGIVARTVPQMNIFMIGISMQIMVGFFVLLFSVSMLGVLYKQLLLKMGESLFLFIRTM